MEERRHQNKLLYFYVYDIEEYKKIRGLNVDLFKEINSATSTNAKEIIKTIENNEYNFEELETFRDKYIGKNYYNNTKKLVDFVFKYLERILLFIMVLFDSNKISPTKSKHNL